MQATVRSGHLAAFADSTATQCIYMGNVENALIEDMTFLNGKANSGALTAIGISPNASNTVIGRNSIPTNMTACNDLGTGTIGILETVTPTGTWAN